MHVEPLRPEDAQAIVDAEDDETVRWLSGGRSTVDGTTEYIARLARDAEQGASKRAFGIWLDDVFVGTADFDPDVVDGLEPGDVNIAYGVAPWARGRGIAVRAVEQICSIIRDRAVGTRAVIRSDVRNPASARVAEKAGFAYLRDVPSSTETLDDGSPVILRVFGRSVVRRSGAMVELTWLRPEDPAEFVRGILRAEAPDIPEAKLEGPWSQIVVPISALTVNEQMVTEHDADPVHRQRRDGFLSAMREGRDVPPLIALGTDLHLVDGYARLRAIRLLGLQDVEVVAQRPS